ncbi:hypothetical protein A8B83_19515 [Rhodobacteraceae bacterium EhC02]|nr:hypothetical protein A8B83_19515 [Rhodobacteraceae bacterium EhC02]
MDIVVEVVTWINEVHSELLDALQGLGVVLVGPSRRQIGHMFDLREHSGGFCAMLKGSQLSLPEALFRKSLQFFLFPVARLFFGIIER